jgi:hypothetical protein
VTAAVRRDSVVKSNQWNRRELSTAEGTQNQWKEQKGSSCVQQKNTESDEVPTKRVITNGEAFYTHVFDEN